MIEIDHTPTQCHHATSQYCPKEATYIPACVVPPAHLMPEQNLLHLLATASRQATHTTHDEL